MGRPIPILAATKLRDELFLTLLGERHHGDHEIHVARVF